MRSPLQHTLPLLALLFCSYFSFGQSTRKNDLIIKRDSTKIEALILEVDEQLIRYKKYSDQEGPTFSVSKKDIASIVYGNGEIEKFAAVPEIYFDEVPAPVAPYQGKPLPPRIRSGSPGALTSEQLRSNYKLYLRKTAKYKTMGVVGLSLGALFTVFGIVTINQATRDYNASGGYYTSSSYDNKMAGGILLVTAGICGGTPLTIIGLINKKRYTRKAVTTEKELQRRGEPLSTLRLSPGFDFTNQSANLTLRMNF